MKTAISLPDELFEKAERLATNMGVSRSHLYARALQTYVERHDSEAITDRLNEVYSEEESSMDNVLIQMQMESIGDEKW